LVKLDNAVDVSAAYTLGAGDGFSTHTAGLSAKWVFCGGRRPLGAPIALLRPRNSKSD